MEITFLRLAIRRKNSIWQWAYFSEFQFWRYVRHLYFSWTASPWNHQRTKMDRVQLHYAWRVNMEKLRHLQILSIAYKSCHWFSLWRVLQGSHETLLTKSGSEATTVVLAILLDVAMQRKFLLESSVATVLIFWSSLQRLEHFPIFPRIDLHATYMTMKS